MLGGAISLLVVVGMIGASCRSGGDSAEADGPPFPETKPFTDALSAELHALRDQASVARGLPVNDAVVEGTLTREQLRDYYAEAYELTAEEELEVRAFNTALRLMGMIETDDDIIDSFEEISGDATAGVYVIDEDRLVLVDASEQLSAKNRTTIVHEYVHSFQDGFFSFDRFDKLIEKEDDKDYAPTEYAVTLSCLREGDAQVSEIVWGMEVFGPDWFDQMNAPVDDTQQPASDDDGTLDAPPAIQRYAFFDYVECMDFVGQLWAEHGWLPIDKAYADPPSTTEQILHPNKFLARERPTSMPPVTMDDRLGDEWERVAGAMFGEFDVYNYLFTILGDDVMAAFAAEGWGTGWISIYETDPSHEDQGVIVHLALEWDTLGDWADFSAVYDQLVQSIALPGTLSGSAPDDGPLCWKSADGYGFFNWDENLKRNDIILATTREAIDTAVNGSLSTGGVPRCR